MITRYECDRCGEEHRGEPAAWAKEYPHMCAGCYDDWEQKMETTA